MSAKKIPARPRRAKAPSYRFWTGKAQLLGVSHGKSHVVLTVSRGATRRVLDAEGYRTDEIYESSAALWANIGSRLVLVCNEQDIGMVEITRVDSDGRTFYATVVNGSLQSGPVVVLESKLHAVAKRRAA